MYISIENLTFSWWIPFVPIQWSTQKMEAALVFEKVAYIYMNKRRRVPGVNLHRHHKRHPK